MAESLLQELKRYVGFGAPDEAALRALHPLAQLHFQSIAEGFYERPDSVFNKFHSSPTDEIDS